MLNEFWMGVVNLWEAFAVIIASWVAMIMLFIYATKKETKKDENKQ